MSNIAELDRQAIKKMTTYNCPKCGQPLEVVIEDETPVAFDCLDCEVTYSFDNIYCS